MIMQKSIHNWKQLYNKFKLIPNQQYPLDVPRSYFFYEIKILSLAIWE